jgi:hypothetical protein
MSETISIKWNSVTRMFFKWPREGGARLILKAKAEESNL